MEGGHPGILGVLTLLALGFHMTVAGVEVASAPTHQAVRRLQTSHVLRVSLAEDVVLSLRARKTTLAQIDNNVSKGDWLMEPLGDNSSPLLVARSIDRPDKGQTVLQILNLTKEVVKLKAGVAIAQASEAEVSKSVDMPINEAP